MSHRVVITGALGFVGRALAERYRTEGAEVVGVDLHADPERGVDAGDVAEPGPWQRAAAGADLVIHTAAVVSNAVGLAGQWRGNVLATRRALDAARDGGARRFVHFSSVRAFSDLDFPDGVDEAWPVRPDGRPYVDTKVAGEQVVLQAHAAGEVEATVIRPADVYGPGSRPWVLLPLAAIRARRLVLPAMGRGIFSPVYIDNLIDGVALAARAPAAAGQVFTIGDGRGVSTREFFAHHHRMLGMPGPRVAPTPVAVALARAASAAARARGSPTEVNAHSAYYLARRGTYSIDKARRVLGYEPRVGLDEGMERTRRWLHEEGLL